MDFNDALKQAKAFSLANLQHIEEDIYLIRDLQGRIRVLLKKEKKAKVAAVLSLAQDIAGALDFYTYPEDEIVIYREKLKHHLQSLNAQTAQKVESNGAYSVYLHDRLLIGGEWDASFAQATAAPFASPSFQ
jgi:hypothetical protein